MLASEYSLICPLGSSSNAASTARRPAISSARRARRGEAGGHALDRGPDRDHLDDFALRLAHHEDAAARDGADETFLFQHRQRLPDRGAADAEVLAQLAFVEPDFVRLAVNIHPHDRRPDRLARLRAQADADVQRRDRQFSGGLRRLGESCPGQRPRGGIASGCDPWAVLWILYTSAVKPPNRRSGRRRGLDAKVPTLPGVHRPCRPLSLHRPAVRIMEDSMRYHGCASARYTDPHARQTKPVPQPEGHAGAAAAAPPVQTPVFRRVARRAAHRWCGRVPAAPRRSSPMQWLAFIAIGLISLALIALIWTLTSRAIDDEAMEIRAPHRSAGQVGGLRARARGRG